MLEIINFNIWNEQFLHFVAVSQQHKFSSTNLYLFFSL